jgi:REP element-mobilizing transposase RayT
MGITKPLILAHHLIFTVYGWWLPNDPRGSMSRFIRQDVIKDLGELHHGRKRVQPASPVIRSFYREAAKWLSHELLTFDTSARTIIAEAFTEVCARETYTCWACAIMPDHVHLIIRKHKHLAEEMIATFQVASRSRLRAQHLRTDDHPTWGGPGWKVFLDQPEDIRRTITYVESNPDALKLPRQHWPFVKPYDNWPLHEGHSPSSPYARRLRAAGKCPTHPQPRSR